MSRRKKWYYPLMVDGEKKVHVNMVLTLVYWRGFFVQFSRNKSPDFYLRYPFRLCQLFAPPVHIISKQWRFSARKKAV